MTKMAITDAIRRSKFVLARVLNGYLLLDFQFPAREIPTRRNSSRVGLVSCFVEFSAPQGVLRFRAEGNCSSERYEHNKVYAIDAGQYVN